METGLFEGSSNTNNRIFGKGRGFPRMFSPTTPCLLDAIRVVLARGPRRNIYIVKALTNLGWMPSDLPDPGHYIDNTLSKCFKKKLLLRPLKGHYQLPSDDARPLQWVNKHLPMLLNNENPDEIKPPVVKTAKSNGQSKSSLSIRTQEPSITFGPFRGRFNFSLFGSKEPMFTVDCEIYPIPPK